MIANEEAIEFINKTMIALTNHAGQLHGISKSEAIRIILREAILGRAAVLAVGDPELRLEEIMIDIASEVAEDMAMAHRFIKIMRAKG